MRSDENSKNLWFHSAPAAPETGLLTDTLTCDVAIIGGGFTGLSAALHLAEAGVDAVVLEANEIGYGGSGRNVGLVNAGMWMRPDDIEAAVGTDVGGRMVRELGDGPSLVFQLIEKHGIQCEAVRNGTLHLAVGKAGLEEVAIRAGQWQKRGAPVEAIGTAETRRLTGSDVFAGALLDRRAGTVQPLGYARGLARAALAAGARIFTASPVRSASKDGATIRLVTESGTVTCNRLIIATNAYSGVVESMGWSEHRQELVQMRYFQFATDPLPASVIDRILPEEHGCWDTGLVMTSFRRDKAGRLIFGSIGALDAWSLGAHRDFSRRALKKIYPLLSDVSFSWRWDGRIGMTSNNLPFFHQPADNVWSIAGYNGRGISPGTVFGRALAQVAMGNADAMMLKPTPVTPDPLRAAKSLFYDVGAAAKHFIDHR